jgi:hypothetical protein
MKSALASLILGLGVASATAATAPPDHSSRACVASTDQDDPVAALEIEALRRRITALEERVEVLEHELDTPDANPSTETRP